MLWSGKKWKPCCSFPLEVSADNAEKPENVFATDRAADVAVSAQTAACKTGAVQTLYRHNASRSNSPILIGGDV